MSNYSWLKIGIYFIGLGLLALMVNQFDRANVSWFASGVWCVAASVPLLAALRQALRSGIAVILTDHMVMLSLAFLIYFVAGTLLLSAGPQQQIDAALIYYDIDALDAMRANAANSIGFGVLIIAFVFSGTEWLGKLTARAAQGAGMIPGHLVIAAFLVIGFLSSAAVAAVDLYPVDQVIDGGYRVLSKFSLIAIYLGVLYSGKFERIIRTSSVAVAVLLSFFGLVLFNKTEVLLPIGILVIGFGVKYRSPKVFAAGMAAILVIFVLIGNAVAWGRNTYSYSGGNVIVSRLYSLVEGFSEGSDATVEGEYYPWARICYTPSQVAGMHFYDTGNGGEDFELIPWLLVPRALVESKPIISGSGEGVHTKITGNTGSSTGLGIFVSGYYNLGWAGLVLASLMCGWILAQTSRVAVEIMSRNVVALFPFVFIGVYIAFRVDGNFVIDFVGLFMYLLVATIFLVIISGLIGVARGK